MSEWLLLDEKQLLFSKNIHIESVTSSISVRVVTKAPVAKVPEMTLFSKELPAAMPAAVNEVARREKALTLCAFRGRVPFLKARDIIFV